jgi:hypothetical protein
MIFLSLERDDGSDERKKESEIENGLGNVARNFGS